MAQWVSRGGKSLGGAGGEGGGVGVARHGHKDDISTKVAIWTRRGWGGTEGVKRWQITRRGLGGGGKLMQKALQAGLAVSSHQAAGQAPHGRAASNAIHMAVKADRKSSSFSREELSFQ